MTNPIIDQGTGLHTYDHRRWPCGIYLVDEQKLRELADEVILELQKRGFLSAIYAHLMSQNQVRNLGRIKVVQEQAAKA